MKKNYRSAGWSPVKSWALVQLVGLPIAGMPLALAQTVNVDPGTSLITNTGATPADGTTWNLTGSGIFLSSTVTLPGSGTVTIDGNGNTLTLNDGSGNYGRFITSTSVPTSTINLSNVTLTGGLNSNGGAIFIQTGGVTINTTGNVAFTGNNSTIDGGAIEINSGNLTLGGAGSTVTIANNTAANSGGALIVFGTTTFIGNTILSNNSAVGTGGGLFSYNNVTSTGSLTANGNTAGNSGSGGAIYSMLGGVTTDAISADGNQAGNNGGAIQATGPVSLAATTGDVTLTNNKAGTTSGTNGGGGAVGSGGGITVGNASGTNTITGNSANWGGAFYMSTSAGSTLAMAGTTTLSNNTATSGGGAVYSSGDATINLNGPTTIDGNAVTNGPGGAIYSRGAVALTTSTGAVSLSNNKASTNGGAIYASGAVTIDANGAVSLGNNKASTNGGAIYAAGDVTINAGAPVTLSGNTATSGAGGAIYTSGNVTLSATGGDINLTNNSASGLGGAIWTIGNATLNATGGNITFQGNLMQDPVANAIWFANRTGNATATLNAAAGRTITFYDPIANAPATGQLTVVATGPGTVIFDGSQYTDAASQWSQVYGNTTVQGGTFVVRNNAVYGTLAADVAQTTPTSFTLASGATLAGGGTGTVRADNVTLGGTLNVAGTATPGTASGGYSVFNVVGNNVAFGPGSQVLFNTYLNDASTQLSDVLVLNLNGSATSGTASIVVNNTGGVGQVTQGDGIELVRTVNGSSANAFTLGKPVEAGAYQYLLYHGGLGANESNGNWYLRSYLEEQPGEPEPPGEPDPGPVAWRPGVAGYIMTPLLNLDYGFTTLGTLHQRVGDVPGAIKPQQNTAANGIWGRANISSFDADTLNRFRANSTTFFAQFGKDWTLAQPEGGGSTHAGATATIGNISGRFHDDSRAIAGLDTETGTVSTQAGSVGGYWTRYLSDGTYFDSVGQVTYYHNRYGGQDGNASQSGVGFTLSQEVGKPFQIGSTPIAIEPQAQLLYQYLSLGDFSDAISPVSGTHTNALRGRAGFRIFSAALSNSDDSSVLTWAKPYVTFNVLHDFLTPGQTVVGGTPFTPALTRTWYEAGAGFTATTSKHGQLYAHAGYRHSLGGDYSQGFYGQIAFRYLW
ncbi:autotransporter outer membrane beta-barrel domain-containing protein [Pandoraea pnomenusa]|uniref:autotransporter outer membrane beta-barrel domain-containing protein n=1 Tax=Pandoraea pnomenusa TaxID=93220 RepID=UPI0033409A15